VNVGRQGRINRARENSNNHQVRKGSSRFEIDLSIGVACTDPPLIVRHKHALTVSLPKELIWIFADVARLEQVIVHVLTNAAKFTHNAGEIWLGLKQKGDECVLPVSDNRIGLSPETLRHVFDLFAQAERSLDRSQGGLGIGLALVKRIVEMHKGRVEVFSVLEQGIEFVVHLPMMASATGFDHHLIKPPDFTELQQLLATVSANKI
jgi:signal transduction histidine kinase